MTEIRPVQKSDIQYIHWLENLQEYWYINEHPGPFSLEDIQDYFYPPKDYRVYKQQRWMIYHTQEPVGVIDVFNLNFDTKQIGMGILIPSIENHNKGIGAVAIRQILALLKKDNEVKRVQALIDLTNLASIRLFEKCNFTRIENTTCMSREVAQFIYTL